MTKFREIESLLAVAKEEGEKFYGQKNNSAGTRYRTALQAIKALAHEERHNVTAERRARQSTKIMLECGELKKLSISNLEDFK